MDQFFLYGIHLFLHICIWSGGSFPPRVYFTKATLRGFSKLAMSPADEFVSFVRKSKSRSIGYYHFGMTKLGTWTPNSLFQLTPMATFKCGRYDIACNLNLLHTDMVGSGHTTEATCIILKPFLALMLTCQPDWSRCLRRQGYLVSCKAIA